MNSDFNACERIDDAASWVLGALPRDTDYGDHLEGCEFCRAEVADLSVGADALLVAVPPVAAPPELIANVMATVRAEAELLDAAGPEADRAPRRRGGWLFGARGLALAAGLVVVIAAAAIVALPGSKPDQVVAGQIIAKNMPASASVKLVGGNDRAHLQVTGLPEAGDGRVYEVWLQQPDGSMKATDALFDVTSSGDGSVHVPDLTDATAIYVTNEPAGGSQQPTTKPIMSVKLQS